MTLNVNVLSVGDCQVLNQQMIIQNKIMSGKSYMITGEIEINTHVTLPANVTLIFAGGMITGSSTLTGNYTRLEAPVTQIFGTDITVDGIWEMDRAYPQWFGAKGDTTSTKIDNGTYTDSADAINKAMKLKHAGEVFIPKGEYVITKTLQVPHGIVLRGELADRRINRSLQDVELIDGDYPLGENTQSTDLSKYYKLGTIIRPLNTAYPLTSDDTTGIFQTSFENNFTIMVNAKKQETLKDGKIEISYPWKHNHPHSITTIRDIQFMNYWTETPSIKGIYCTGGMKLENLAWSGFVQAVASNDDLYSDGKTIVNCIFNAPDFNTGEDFFNHQKNEEGEITWADNDYYAFDLSGLGDKLYFHRNHINPGNITGGLKLSSTFGAEVSCNIINDNIFIRNSKGISFFSNHCEYGVQVEVSMSQVDFSNNYFHKGKNPTFLFHCLENRGSVNVQHSTISLRNNTLISIDNNIDTNSSLYTPNLSEYDIQTDGYLTLTLQDSYRYRVAEDAGGSMYPYGLAILKETWTELEDETLEVTTTPFTEFNGLSYLLSAHCTIKPQFYIEKNHLVADTAAISLQSMVNENVRWYKLTQDITNDSAGNPQGVSYQYSAEIVWDKTRAIVSPTTLSESQLSPLLEVKEVKDENDVVIDKSLIVSADRNKNQGILLRVAEINSCGKQALIHLIRQYRNGIFNMEEDVYVPICGTNFMHDNGISIAGFKWNFKPVGILFQNTMIQSIHFIGNNVICKGSSCPMYGEWTVGDIVYNTGTTTTNAMWIYTDDGWQAR